MRPLTHVHLILTFNRRSKEITDEFFTYTFLFMYILHTYDACVSFKKVSCSASCFNVFPVGQIGYSHDIDKGQSDLDHTSWMDLEQIHLYAGFEACKPSWGENVPCFKYDLRNLSTDPCDLNNDVKILK